MDHALEGALTVLSSWRKTKQKQIEVAGTLDHACVGTWTVLSYWKKKKKKKSQIVVTGAWDRSSGLLCLLEEKNKNKKNKS